MNIKKFLLAGILAFSFLSPVVSWSLNILSPNMAGLRFTEVHHGSSHFSSVQRAEILKQYASICNQKFQEGEIYLPDFCNSEAITTQFFPEHLHDLLQMAPSQKYTTSQDPKTLQRRLMNPGSLEGQWLVVGFEDQLFLCHSLPPQISDDTSEVALSFINSAFCYDFDNLNTPPQRGGEPVSFNHITWADEIEDSSSINSSFGNLSAHLSLCYKPVDHTVLLKLPEEDHLDSFSRPSSLFYENCSRDNYHRSTCKTTMEVSDLEGTKTALLKFLDSVPITREIYYETKQQRENANDSAPPPSPWRFGYDNRYSTVQSIGGVIEDKKWSPYPPAPLSFLDGSVPACATVTVEESRR